MKKIILILAICAIGMISKAQSLYPVPMVNPNGVALDTASQAAAEGATLIVKGAKKTVSIVLQTLKISGTVAGTVAWQGSNDGVHYATISTTALVDQTAGLSYEYKETDKGFLYYKALITQTGTSSISYSASLYATIP
jgi:hypothetical protein